MQSAMHCIHANVCTQCCIQCILMSSRICCSLPCTPAICYTRALQFFIELENTVWKNSISQSSSKVQRYDICVMRSFSVKLIWFLWMAMVMI